MNKKSLEITMALGCVILFVILIGISKEVMATYAGFGYAASLLIFILVMGFVGLKLAEMPDK